LGYFGTFPALRAVLAQGFYINPSRRGPAPGAGPPREAGKSPHRGGRPSP